MRHGGAAACTTPSVQVRHAYFGRRVTITRTLAGILSSRRDVSSPITCSAPPQHGECLDQCHLSRRFAQGHAPRSRILIAAVKHEGDAAPIEPLAYRTRV